MRSHQALSKSLHSLDRSITSLYFLHSSHFSIFGVLAITFVYSHFAILCTRFISRPFALFTSRSTPLQTLSTHKNTRTQLQCVLYMVTVNERAKCFNRFFFSPIWDKTFHTLFIFQFILNAHVLSYAPFLPSLLPLPCSLSLPL